MTKISPITEKTAVKLFNSIYAFLERNGEKLTSDFKVEKAKGLLNKMANPVEANNENPPDEPRNEAFDPRNPETYRLATNNQLIIDGVEIYSEYTNCKEPVTEKAFVKDISMSLEIQKSSMVWEEAIKLANRYFQERGVDKPDQSTPGYNEQINDYYRAILKNTAVRLTKKQEKEYIDSHVKRKIAECTPKNLVNYGGYDFSEAQLEVLSGLNTETIERIGEIMLSNESGSLLKQKIFNSFAIDSLWVVELRHHDPIYEEDIMRDYYASFDNFSSKQEACDFFNSRPYLRKRPELKQAIIENMIELLFGGD